jgi:hypothetical protein
MVSAISNVKRGIKSSENRASIGRYAAWGRWDSRTWDLAPAPTTFHLLSYLSQHIPHQYRPVDSAHRKHAWAVLETRCRWNLRSNYEIGTSVCDLCCVALLGHNHDATRSQAISCISFSGPLSREIGASRDLFIHGCEKEYSGPRL